MLIFKVDFEKDFDSVSWKYLDFVLLSLGFGSKWRSWIRACLHSSRASILINGSPTSEFSIKRGLRQGDPLSLFLFILVMEGLHCAMSNAVNSGLIRGIKLVSYGIVLSHLFYADDVIITTDWNSHDIDNIIRLLQVKWSQVLSSFEKGGLNISSLKAFNLTLLQKWRWRMFSSPNTMWVTTISSRRLIDSKLLPSIQTSTLWDKILPRKVNIFLWRLSLDWLPHHLNLSSRGIDIPSISCSSCNAFFWWIWRYRNSIIFCVDPIKKGDLFDNICASSFFWLSHMGRVSCNWVEWLKNPLLLAGS
ncbi:RNA-directed DNA polymerase, eukaryota, reverse transcriptase zinc-binding domain protein [Tanacetum coccineum]